MHGQHIEATSVAVEYLRLIPLLPLVGAAVLALFGDRAGRRVVAGVACLGVALSFLLALNAFFELGAAGEGAALVDGVYRWISAGPLTINFTLTVDALSAVMCLVITGVGLLIHIYSIGYMGHDPDFARYFAYLNLFTASMLVLVLADSLPVMFVGWEGVGLCSYLLIGFWYTDMAKASAGKKAFVVNRIGDAAFIVGMLVLFWALHDGGAASLRFADINAAAPALSPAVALAAGLLLFVGATGKSAQLPLFVWLPDAMAGPTPVSALIHAATMVTAGIYMIARLNGLYVAAPEALMVVGIVGAVTALGAALVGTVQNDIKKVLAYSTVSQLGYMFIALGAGAFGAAVFHVVTHAFFKALLFLGAGSVIHGLGEEQDIRNMGGLREKMPITSRTFVVATLAIAGVPGLSGFFSKDEILASTFASGHTLLWAMGVAGAGLTAFYMTRLVRLTFYGSYRGPRETWDAAHESPSSMTSVLMVLALLAAIGGYLGVPAVLGGSNHFGHYLSGVVGHHELGLTHLTELLLMVVSVSVAIAAMVVAWRLYADGPEPDQAFAKRAAGLQRSLANAYYIDQAYDRGVVAGVGAFARGLWRWVDVGVIDAIANGIAGAVQALSGSWRRWASGNVQQYALSLLLGVAIIAVAVVAGAGR